MTYIYTEYDYLAHHGIKGMKWGVRKEREKTLRKKKKREEEKKKKHSGLYLSDRQKKLLKIGAISAAAIVSAYALSKINRGNRGSSLTNSVNVTNNFNLANKKETLSLASIPHCSTSRDKNLKAVNIGMDLDDSIIDAVERSGIDELTEKQLSEINKHILAGRLFNCSACTAAGNLRARGYDVVAGKMLSGKGPLDQASWWKNGKVESLCGATTEAIGKSGYNPLFEQRAIEYGNELRQKDDREKSISIIKKRLLSYGNNASGAFNAVNGLDGGHAVEFLVENGNVRIFDYQIGRKYASIESWFDTTKFSPHYSYWLRTDNLTPDLSEMMSQKIIKVNRR